MFPRGERVRLDNRAPHAEKKYMTKSTKFQFVNFVMPFLRLLGLALRPNRVSSLVLAVRDYDFYLSALSGSHNNLIAAQVGKDLFARAKRVAFGVELLPQSGPFWFRSDSNGLPRRLWRVNRLVASGRCVDRVVGLTIYNLFRLINHKPVVSYSGPLDPPSWSCPAGYRDMVSKFISHFRMHRLKLVRKHDLRDVWLSNKGVSGLPSVLTVPFDCYVLLQHPDLFSACEKLTSKWYQPFRLRRWVGALSMSKAFALRSKILVKDPVVGKYNFISEGGGKTRGVTPVNFVIQATLRPYHDLFMECLRLLPMDCSFAEAAGLEKIKVWSSKGLPLNSVDLSDATDRWPLDVSITIICELLGNEVADSVKVLLRLPVQFGRSVKVCKPFAVGAPMGIYSLWPIFALSHHCIVQLAAIQCGKRFPFKDYVLRGDDVVIVGHEVTDRYIKLIDELGVKTSTLKTYRSPSNVGIAEFAKHLFIRGRDHTPISAKQLRAMRIDPFCVLPIIGHSFDLIDHSDIGTGVTPVSILSFFFKRGRRERLLQWLSLEFNSSAVAQWPERFRPEPVFWSYANAKRREFISSAVNKVMVNDLLREFKFLIGSRCKDFERGCVPPILVSIPDLHFNNHPYFYKMIKCLDELKALKVDLLDIRPQFAPSRLLFVLRAMKGGYQVSNLSRKTARYQLASRYLKVYERVAVSFGEAKFAF